MCGCTVDARDAENADQARRLLAIAAAYEGQDQSAAAKIGAMDDRTSVISATLDSMIGHRTRQPRQPRSDPAPPLP
jgi:hypothetical protein